MTVSVVIPARNRASFLKSCLQSVVMQTEPVMEVLVIDDESTDDSKNVVESFGEKFKFFSQPFINQSVARNYGVGLAKGELIAFLDSDDLWLEKKIEEQVNFMDAHPDCVFSYTDSVVIDFDGKEVPHSYVYHYSRVNDYYGSIASRLFREYNVIPTSTVMARKSLIQKVGGFDDRLSYHEDRELWIRLAREGNVGFLDKILSVYTVHSGQFTTNKDQLREEQWKIVVEKCQKLGL